MLVHDGIPFELDSEEQVRHAIEIMRIAGTEVCGGVEIGVDTDQKLTGGERYRHKRPVAKRMWQTVRSKHWGQRNELHPCGETRLSGTGGLISAALGSCRPLRFFSRQPDEALPARETGYAPAPSSTCLIFSARSFFRYGLFSSATPGSSRPWCTIAFSV
jgi:hypothetical protein